VKSILLSRLFRYECRCDNDGLIVVIADYKVFDVWLLVGYLLLMFDCLLFIWDCLLLVDDYLWLFCCV